MNKKHDIPKILVDICKLFPLRPYSRYATDDEISVVEWQDDDGNYFEIEDDSGELSAMHCDKDGVCRHWRIIPEVKK